MAYLVNLKWFRFFIYKMSLVCKIYKKPSCHYGKMSYLQYKQAGRALHKRGWSGGAMVLGKLPVPGRPTIWMIVGQGPFLRLQ